MIEIDGVTLALEQSVTEAGDYIADKYVQLIDWATAPRNAYSESGFSHRNEIRIANCIHWLNINVSTTSVLLFDEGLGAVYDSVVGQLNTITTAIPKADQLQQIIPGDSKYQDYSGSFKWSA